MQKSKRPMQEGCFLVLRTQRLILRKGAHSVLLLLWTITTVEVTKNVPHPPPHALEPLPRPCVYITVLWHRRCKRVCVLVLRHPLFPFRIYPPPAPLDASWRSLLKALKSSPFALRLVCRSVSLPRFLTRSYFLRTDCKAMPWFLPVKTACFVPCPWPNDAHASGPCLSNTLVFLSLLFI